MVTSNHYHALGGCHRENMTQLLACKDKWLRVSDPSLRQGFRLVSSLDSRMRIDSQGLGLVPKESNSLVLLPDILSDGDIVSASARVRGKCDYESQQQD